VLFDTRRGVGVVVLANARTYDEPMALARHLVAGEPLEPPPPAPAPRDRATLPTELLASYAGRYQAARGAVYEIAVNGANLLVRYPNDAIYEFVPEGPRDFYYHGGNDDIAFETDDAGRATAILVFGDGRAAGTFERAQRETHRDL
jgi:hypothetical protein